MSDWDGVVGATDHRTTGSRAWCFQDKEWCYPDGLCECCMKASTEFVACVVCDGVGYVRLDSVGGRGRPVTGKVV